MPFSSALCDRTLSERIVRHPRPIARHHYPPHYCNFSVILDFQGHSTSSWGENIPLPTLCAQVSPIEDFGLHRLTPRPSCQGSPSDRRKPGLVHAIVGCEQSGALLQSTFSSGKCAFRFLEVGNLRLFPGAVCSCL